MNEKEKQIAIAEACGWAWLTKVGSYTTQHFAFYTPEDVIKLEQYGYQKGKIGVVESDFVFGLNTVPDYLNDYNAMRGALMALNDDQFLMFMLNLCFETNTNANLRKWTVCEKLLKASAEQLAEAFIKTLNLTL